MTKQAADQLVAEYAGLAHLEARVRQRGGAFFVELRRVAGGDWFRAPMGR